MSKKRKSSFKGKVSTNVEKTKTSNKNYGYLNIPQGVPLFKIEEGSRYKFDVLPYEVTDKKHPDREEEYGIAMPGDLWYKRPFKIHRSIGPDNDSVVCLTSFGKKCPICEERQKLFASNADKKETDALKPSARNLYIVIPLGKKDDPVPHIWDMSHYSFQKQLNEEIEENEDYEIFPDLEEGLTLEVRFTEETFQKNKFYVSNRIDFVERDEPYDESILDDLPNLDEVLKMLTYDELSALFYDLDPEDLDPEEEEEADEKPAPKRKKKVIKKEEVEEDDDDEDDDEDEEEAPAPKRKKKVIKKEPEPEPEEDDDDEEEDEEEAPAPKRKLKRTEKTKPSGNKCPAGHKFGVDIDTTDDCDSCDLWDACNDEYEKNN